MTIFVLLAPEPLSLKIIIPVSMASAILSLIVAVYIIKSGYSCSNMRKDARSAAKSELVIENAYQSTDDKASTDNSSVLYINNKTKTTPLTSNITPSELSSAVKQPMPREGYISLAKAKGQSSVEGKSTEPSNLVTKSSPQDDSPGYVLHNELMRNTATIKGSTFNDSKACAIQEVPISAGTGDNVKFKYVSLAQINAFEGNRLQSESRGGKTGRESKFQMTPSEVGRNDDNEEHKISEAPQTNESDHQVNYTDTHPETPQILDVSRLPLYISLAQAREMEGNTDIVAL